MGTSKRYNSIPVKDNYALFSPIPSIIGDRQSNGAI